ncbi:MAG: FAD-dependent thymidylate synthase, partial [Proteobacteria bacterium]|nr:FAD-dependent thymidylate synthase [Pseudomonadota bacterium]
AMRRVAPIGLATNIGWSCNIRTLRHVIEQRTAPWAEEEIRLVFAQIAEIAIAKWPNMFSDYSWELVDGLPVYTTKNRKV